MIESAPEGSKHVHNHPVKYLGPASLVPASSADQEHYATIESFCRSRGWANAANDPVSRPGIEWLMEFENRPVIAVLTSAVPNYTHHKIRPHEANHGYIRTLDDISTRAADYCYYVDLRADIGDHLYLIGGALWSVEDDPVYSDEERELLLLAAVRRAEIKKERALQQARLTLSDPNEGSAPQRQSIADDVKLFVWQRDRGQCVRCESRAALEFDHIIPIVMGGSNTERNLQLLCGPCNRAKGGNLA